MTASANRLTLGLMAGVALLLLTGCGGGCGTCDEYWVDVGVGWYGSIDVDNYSLEFVDTFFLSPAASGAWTDELLGWPLAPGEGATIGDFEEDFYDAEADLEFGDLVQWFDVLVPAEEITIFEVY